MNTTIIQRLLFLQGVIALLIGSLTTYFFTFQIVEWVGDEFTYRFDYGPILFGTGVCVVTTVLALLVRAFARTGVIIAVVAFVIVSLLGVFSLYYLIPELIQLLTLATPLPFYQNSFLLGQILHTSYAISMTILSVIILKKGVTLLRQRTD